MKIVAAIKSDEKVVQYFSRGFASPSCSAHPHIAPMPNLLP